jgi:hypothetical protein
MGAARWIGCHQGAVALEVVVLSVRVSSGCQRSNDHQSWRRRWSIVDGLVAEASRHESPAGQTWLCRG